MYSRPLANHLTWGTYGTRLHGDARTTVDRRHNQYGEPTIEFDQHRWERETGLLRFAQVVFEPDRMIEVEALIPPICDRGGWRLIECACGPDHVHVLLDTNGNEPKAVRKWLKRWLGEALSTRHSVPEGATWWAECGSVKYVFEPDYFNRVGPYIRRQRATPA